MTVTVVTASRWAPLMDHLAQRLDEATTDPFATLRVVVATPATGRVVSQQIAARLSISAGIDYLSPAALLRQLAGAAGVERDLSRWHGTPLELAVAEALPGMTDPLLQRALAPDPLRPGRRRATAIRLAGLLRSYLDHAPELLAQWLAGSDEGPGGAEIPARLGWQPQLFRAVSSALELDPLAMVEAIERAAREDQTPTFAVALEHLTAPQQRALRGLAEARAVTSYEPTGSTVTWADGLAAAPVHLDGEPAPAPHVEVHNSHGEARQVEVLRDELTRAFAADPTLEPRHVVIVCPRPERYAGLLDAAFAPADDVAHPGRTLRLQPLGSFDANPVLTLLVRLLRLGSSRATATDLTDLLLSTPIAHRWRLTDRQAVLELVSGAGIRWGLDAEHRASFELAEVAQNTWLRGLDRLLIGLAVPPGIDAGLGLSGAEAVSASDLPLVGALSEVLSRLRRTVAATSTPATMAEWVARSREALAALVGLPYADQWQELHALSVLARFEADHADHATLLSPHEFAHVVEEAGTPPRARVAAGNGALQVIPLGELQHVEFRVVAMLGLTDDVVPGRGGALPDALDLGVHAPDLPARRLQQLLLHARCAERLIVVQQARSQRTNDPAAHPVAVTWLLSQLGVSPTIVEHPPTATSEANFGPRASFDAAAHHGAAARRASAGTAQALTARRRFQARSRQVGEPPSQVSLTQLTRFLSDPAKTFLRAAGGIPLYEEASLTDEMPLTVQGLDHWRIVNALVDSWKAGTLIETVESYFRQREDLPPQAIGDAAFAKARQEATLLWESAWDEWSGPQADHAVDVVVDLGAAGTVRVVDEVRTRSGFALAATPSRTDTGIFRPWLESLALAASGVEAPAKLHYFVKNQQTNFAIGVQQWLVAPPAQGEAMAQLTTLVDAYAQAQHRLLPAPSGPALSYARDYAVGRFTPAQWSGPIGDYRGRWASPGPAWRLFFAADVRELFHDTPLPQDPDNGHPSAFQAWAWQLYGPLMGGAGA